MQQGRQNIKFIAFLNKTNSMNPASTTLRRLYEDPKYMSLFALIAAILIFYPTTYYAFIPYYIWIITFNYFDQAFYLAYINYNILSPGEFAVKALIFTILLSAAVLISIGISQMLTKTIAEKPEETVGAEVIQYWKTSKKITSIALILEYLTLILLIALLSLVWYDISLQYSSTFLKLARYSLLIISALGILCLIHPTLDDKETLTKACLNIIDSIREGHPKEYLKNIELVHFILYLLLNYTLSKNIKDLEEFNLKPSLTTLYIALLKKDKETLTKAKNLTTKLLKAINDENVPDILEHLSEIDKKLGDTQKLAKTMEISVIYPSLTLYAFNPSQKIARLKALLPLMVQILLAVFIFLGKWIFYAKV